jgi:transcriptional regulator with PAS, ATPase and Fis domain
LNCASLGGELLSSELFGHEKGAFTGAHERKLGLVEIAHRGTLFLDEIGDLSADVQAKLLKVLEERRVRRVGGTADIPVELRLISATNRNLAAAADAGRFRLDLYYRIAALPIVLPPLRERREDIPALAQALLASLASSAAHKRELAPDALAKLQEHHWPGNIRELRNVLERAVLLSHSPVLRADDLPVLPAGPTSRRGQAETVEEAPDAPLRSLAEVEREHIERVLRAVGGHVQRAAEILGIPRSTLYQKLKRFRLKSPRTA